MATLLYVASTETFVGKSAVCMGLISHLRRDGFEIGYMKPVSVSAAHTTETTLDEDAALIRETLGLEASVDQIAPVFITPQIVDAILSGRPPAFAEKIQEGYRTVARNKEIVIMEGTNRWVEGALVDLAADQVITMLNAPVLLVCRYHSTLTVDNILTVQRYLNNRVVGVLLNQIETPQLDFVQKKVAPFLESRGIMVLGMLPHEPFLASVSIGEIEQHLGGAYVGSPEWRGKLVESIMVGAMGAESSLSFFRRRANKAVITGGDRIDLQLVALETSTSALILTGNMRPALNVMNRAEEREVPIIVVPTDTLTTVENCEKLFGRVRFRQHAKLQHFIELMERHFDYQRLYDTLGLRKG
jgi:uncharacterized protein